MLTAKSVLNYQQQSSSQKHSPLNNNRDSHRALIDSSYFQETENFGRQKVSALYASLGWCMHPFAFLLLSFLPFVIYAQTASIFFASLFLGLTTLFCSYCYFIQLQRQRVACALGIVSDPDILELVAKYMPGWAISSDNNRVDWLNHILQSSWPMIGAFAEIKLSTKIKEIFQREKPELVTSMELTDVVAGTIPPKILSIHVLDPTSSHSPSSVSSRSYCLTFL